MAVTGVRHLLSVSNSTTALLLSDAFSRTSAKVDELSRTRSIRRSTSLDEVDTCSEDM